MSQISLSETAKAKIEARQQERKSIQDEQSKYVKLGDKESVVLQFDPEKEAKLVESTNPQFNTKSKRYEYDVYDPNQGRPRIFAANLDASSQIDNLFVEGFCTLKIRRDGAKGDKNTKYFVTPAGAGA